MKTYYGNYLGMVINSSDPEYRGRVQVFVPHIMPALYEGWNKEGTDIQISCVGSNIPEGLTPEIHARLVQILPWAEAASPIIGASAPGNLFSDIVAGVEGAAAAVAKGVTSFFSQEPSSSPITPSGATGTDIANAAAANLNFSTANIEDTGGGNLGCAAAVSKIFKDGTGQNVIPGRSVVTSTNELYNHMSTSKDWVRVPKDQIQPGDILVTARGNQPGHTGVYTGVGPYTITSNSSSGFMGSARGTIQANYNLKSWEKVEARNPGQSGVFRYVGPGAAAPSGTEPSSGTSAASSGSEKTAPSAEQSSPNVLSQPSPSSEFFNTPKVPEQGAIQLTPGAGTIEGGTLTGGGTASNVDTSNMSPAFKAQYERVLKSMEGSKFDPATTSKPVIPNDGATYGITTGSKEEWAHFFTRNASAESSFNPNTAADINGLRQGTLTSFGLYQMGNTQFNRHGGGNIYNPDDATKAYVNYAEEMYFGNTYRSGGQNVIGGRSADGKWLGLAAGYGPIRRISTGNPNTNEKQLLAENMSKSEKQAGNYTGTVSNPTASPSGSMKVVNNTDSYGRTPITNTNDMANGLFAYPNPGAMVWVFFREGNPLYPVYFAASYSSAEWSSAYRGGSKATGYFNDGKKISRATNFKPDQAGGLYTKFETNLEDTTGIEEKASIQLYHKGGSNVTFDNGIDFYHSHFARRDEVEQDRFVVTKGYKEQWIEGDYSTNVRGDLMIKVGKFDEESMKAMQELAKISAETNKQLTQSSS